MVGMERWEILVFFRRGWCSRPAVALSDRVQTRTEAWRIEVRDGREKWMDGWMEEKRILIDIYSSQLTQSKEVRQMLS